MQHFKCVCDFLLFSTTNINVAVCLCVCVRVCSAQCISLKEWANSANVHHSYVLMIWSKYVCFQIIRMKQIRSKLSACRHKSTHINTLVRCTNAAIYFKAAHRYGEVNRMIYDERVHVKNRSNKYAYTQMMYTHNKIARPANIFIYR